MDERYLREEIRLILQEKSDNQLIVIIKSEPYNDFQKYSWIKMTRPEAIITYKLFGENKKFINVIL